MFRPFRLAHGVDISDKMMRIVEAYDTNKGIIINAFGEIPVPSGIIVEGEIKDTAKASELLQNLYNAVTGKISSPFAIVAVPERKTFTKIATIEKLPESEIDDAIQFEAEQHFPVPLEDMYLAWSLLETKKESQTILLSAADKNIIEQYTLLFEENEKYLIVAEPETFAVKRALLKNQSEPTLIIDLGKSKTTLSIVVNDTIAYTTTIQFSGNVLTSKISKELNLSEEQAERAKLLFGMNPRKSKGAVRKLLIPLFEPLFDQVNDIIRYYTNTFESSQTIAQILLCGGGSQMEGILEYCNEQLHIPTSNKKIQLNTNNKVTRDFSQKGQLSFTTALGLALRSGAQTSFEVIQ